MRRDPESCIEHHNARSIPIRADYMHAAGGDLCVAVLLAQFEHKTNCIVEANRRSKERNTSARKAGKTPTQDTDLWFYFAREDMAEELLFAFDERTIRRKLRSMEGRFVESRHDSNDRRRTEYRLLVDNLQTSCNTWHVEGREKALRRQELPAERLDTPPEHNPEPQDPRPDPEPQIPGSSPIISGQLPTNSDPQIVGNCPLNAGTLPTNYQHNCPPIGGQLAGDLLYLESEEESDLESEEESDSIPGTGQAGDGPDSPSSLSPNGGTATAKAPAESLPPAPALPRYLPPDRLKLQPDPSPVEERAARAAPGALDCLYRDLAMAEVTGPQADHLVHSYSEARIRHQLLDLPARQLRAQSSGKPWNPAQVLISAIRYNDPTAEDRRALQEEIQRPVRLCAAPRSAPPAPDPGIQEAEQHLATLDPAELDRRREEVINSSRALPDMLESELPEIREAAEKTIRQRILQALARSLPAIPSVPCLERNQP